MKKIHLKIKQLFIPLNMLMGTMLCTTNLMCTDILEATKQGNSDTLAYACNLYREWFLLLLVPIILIWCLLPNTSKAKPVFGGIVKGLLFGYVVSIGYNLITGTLDTILLKFGLSATSGGTASGGILP